MRTKRINIGLNPNVYERLNKIGKFGESYSEVIDRVLDELYGKEKK